MAREHLKAVVSNSTRNASQRIFIVLVYVCRVRATVAIRYCLSGSRLSHSLITCRTLDWPAASLCRGGNLVRVQ